MDVVLHEVMKLSWAKVATTVHDVPPGVQFMNPAADSKTLVDPWTSDTRRDLDAYFQSA